MSMISHTGDTVRAGSGNLVGRVSAFVGRIAAAVADHVAERRAYAELMSLDDRTLADIGVARNGDSLQVVRPERIRTRAI